MNVPPPPPPPPPAHPFPDPFCPFDPLAPAKVAVVDESVRLPPISRIKQPPPAHPSHPFAVHCTRSPPPPPPPHPTLIIFAQSSDSSVIDELKVPTQPAQPTL